MNGDEVESMFLFLVAIALIIAIGYYGIYNPVIKISQGCWSWERNKEFTNYSLIDYYNLTCENIRDIILIGAYPELEYARTQTFCKGKLIKEDVSTYFISGFKEEYTKRCVGLK